MTDGVIHSPDSLQNQTSHVAPNDQILDVVKSKRGQTKLRYICDICNREFTKKCGLANHLLIHAGNNLRRHKVKHLPKVNKNADKKVTQVNENLLKVWEETSKAKNFQEALKQGIIKKLHSSTAQTLQDNMSDSSATIFVSGLPASNYNGGNSSAANLLCRQPPPNYDGSNSCAAIALNKLPTSINVNVGTINEEQCNNAKSKISSKSLNLVYNKIEQISSNSKLNVNSIAENGSVNSLFVSSLSKENSQTPTSDSINAENIADNHFMDLEESNDTKNAREIKDICKSLSITIDNDSKIEKNKTKSLLNAFSFSETKSKETQIFLKLENLKKNRESSNFFCENQTSISSESNKLLEKTIVQKYFCQSSADNDLEQDLTVASDVLKNINNDRLLLPKDPNVGPSTLKTCEGDTQCSNTSINILNKVEFMPSIKKDFQSNVACETENNLSEDAHMLNISSHVSKISIPFNYLLMPKIENTQHISHELKIVDDIVKEYKTSQISLPSKDVDIQILSTFHDNVQPVPNESYNENVRTVQTPSTTVAESLMDAFRNKTDSGIEMNAPGNIKILSSTFNNTEDVVLDSPKPFVCDLCKASFTAQKEYLMHVFVHLTGSQTTCYLCAKKFQDNVQLREHILRHNKGEGEELLQDKGNNDELLHDEEDNDELLHDKEVIDELLYDKEEDEELMHHKEGKDNSFDEDLCSLGSISPCDISLEDIESMNFDENFDEKITKMFALTCIEKLNGNDSDSEDVPYDDEATILYSCEESQPPKAHYILTENQKRQNSTTTFTFSSDTELRGEPRAPPSNTCLDFSNVRFISQTPAKTASNLDSQEHEVSVNNPQLSLKNCTECSFEPTSQSNCAEVNDLKLSSFIDIQTKKFNNSINHGLEIIKGVYDNFGEVVVNSVNANETDNFSQNSFSENRSQFENAVTESCILIDSKSNSDISIEISNNHINTADISSKLNKNPISTNQIENTLDNKLLIDETDAFSKLNSFTIVKQIFNTINEDLMIPKNQDEGINKIATNKSIDNVCLELNLTSDVKQFINSTNEDLLMKQNQDKSINTSEIYDNCIKETNDFLEVATNVDRNQTDSSINYNLLMNGNRDNISKIKICGDVLSKLNMTNNTTQTSNSKKDKLLMTYDKNKVRNKMCYICNSGFSDRRGLLSHVKIHIKQAELKSVKGKLSENIRNCIMAMKEKFYECDVCKMLFARRDRLLKHRLTHTARDQHLCEYCGCTFKRKDQLKTHLASHRGNDFEDIELNFGLNLGDTDLVSLEPTLHTTKKTHTCSQCLKVYAKKSALQCHFLTHTGQRPHQCPLCDMAFAQRTNLKRHILSHSGIKPFMCNICRKHFARKPDLRKHYLSHSSEELFTLIGKLPDA
ncbi:hypothetical protein JTE90_014358 [Oedothorax gibbosus]|uniref:C2H2-type domain-containing protein n=1 Tax=Oedothorax gibbosus TaxID=931172 RepID=A0AAV6UDA1_9ARAC|nr:hypothetical protein JTE90_014358 [Oedothorax gibbosus]